MATEASTIGRVFQDKDFVGVTALDLDKTTQMAADEVSRISTTLAALSNEILMCESGQERRSCVKKALREYETAVKWVQVIVGHDEELEKASLCLTPKARSVEAEPAATGKIFATQPSPASSPPRLGNTVSSAPPAWSALGSVPPPPSHAPSLPIGRNPAAQAGPQAFQLEVGSWSNRSSTTTLSPDASQALPQLPGLEHLQGPPCNQNFNMNGAGSWSNRSSSVDSLNEFQEAPSFGRHQQLQTQGARTMLNLNPMMPPQQRHQQQQMMQTAQQQHAHPQQQLVNQIQQELGHMMLPNMPGLRPTQQQNMQPQQQGHGMQNMHQLPNGQQVQVIAVPMGAPPPAGTILAASPAPVGSIPTSEHFQPMSEIYPQDICKPASSNKFRIVNPSTGEEVHAPSDNDKNPKRFAIVNPGTGEEVLPTENEKENTHINFGELSDDDENKANVGASWDWPLSRPEIRERIVASSD